MTPGWFITGTDTGVGKTRVALALLTALNNAGYKTAAMKPVACGSRRTALGLRHEDAELLAQHAGISRDYAEVNPYVFAPAIAPHIAAQESGCTIEIATILQNYRRLCAAPVDAVVVEGAGGWCVPINGHETLETVARALQLPVILVVGMRLGCLNHALLTAAAITASGASLAGWVANTIVAEMSAFEANVAALRTRLRAPLLATLPYAPAAEAATLAHLFDLSALVIESN